MAELGHVLPIIPWEEITLDKKLGEGGFGIVFRGNWKHGGDVAIKQIKGMLRADAAQELRDEAEVMARLNSPYIIRLFGVCWEAQKYAIVMELMPKASLYDLLHNGQPLPWGLRYNIAQDIAYGLSLLHARHILHRDLKSLNVLLDHKLRAKLTDFGLAKVKSSSRATTKASEGLVGTIAWMAPELFSLSPKYTESSDVYAYGMVGLELATRDIPYKDVANYNIIKDAVKSGERADIPDECPASFAELIKSCWAQDPKKRPTMEMVVATLERTIKTEGYSYEVAPAPVGSYIYQDVTSSRGVVTQTEVVRPTAAVPLQSAADYELGCKLYNNEKDREALNCFLKISSNEAHPCYLAACLKLWDIYTNGNDISSDRGEIEYYAKIISSKIGWFLRQADSGNSDAQYNLGCLYFEGVGIPKDYSQARVWLEKAATQGLVNAQYLLGMLYTISEGGFQDFIQARAWYEKAAAQGYAKAAYALGVMCERGSGIEQDYRQAFTWYEKAAAQGHVNSSYALGAMCERGKGIEQDYARAFTWYEKAAEQGHAKAAYALGIMYDYGRGIEQDYRQAIAWYERAAIKGYAEAQCALGKLYYEGEKNSLSNIRMREIIGETTRNTGIPQNYAQAYAWFEKAAAQGNVEAQYKLGCLYYGGRGVKQDYETARILFENAAVKGNAHAQFYLGMMYAAGKGVRQDYLKEKDWYEKAAAQGHTVAQYATGTMYSNGQGVIQDYDQARAWYEKAAAQGHEDAKKALAELSQPARRRSQKPK